MVIVVRSVFHEDNKHNSQDVLGEYLYKLLILEYDRIDVNKTNGLREYIICYY